MKSKIFATLAAGVMALASFAASAADTLRVGTHPTFAPFEFLDSSSREYVGFDMDMIREIGKRMKVEVEFVNMGFDGLIPALMTNNIDIVVSGVTITEERKKRVDFCEPYYQAGQGLMIRVGDEAKYQKIEDLHNKTIAVQIGTTGAEVAKGIPGTKIKAFNTSAEAFMDLKMNGSDVVITDRPVIGYFLVTNARAAKGLKRQPMQFDSEYFGFAVKKGNTEFNYKDVDYTVDIQSDDFYVVYQGGDIMGYASRDLVNEADGAPKFSFDVKLAALTAMTAGESDFTADGVDYTLNKNGEIAANGEQLGYVSRFVVSAADSSVVVTRDFKDRLEEAINENADKFNYTDAEGNEAEYDIVYDASTKVWSVKQMTETYVYDRYASPSKAHWLGTDTNGMDMLTRLMYGGRVSLIIGFIVVVIEASLGILMGGISGYFGGWIDNIIMRVVDVFYCIPSMPVIIIIGAAMDAMRVDSWKRMLYLMLILGFLGWPSIARLVRGQILSLREQEFMMATEACGIKVWHRIFRHLIPNVIPQLIVTCTMGLGSTILTEATLSFLGLGVKYPFASWGNIINDVNNAYVMTNYLFIWIPAGVCLLLTVLGFNFVGDGLRDAFDPKMKR